MAVTIPAHPLTRKANGHIIPAMAGSRPRKVNKPTPDLIKKARDYFVHGRYDDDGVYHEPSLMEAAREFNLNRGTVTSYAQKDEWRRCKREYKEMHREEMDKQHAEMMARLAAPVEVNVVKHAAILSGKILKAAENAAEVSDDGGMSSGEARNNANTMSVFQKSVKLAKGEAGEITKVEGIRNDEISGYMQALWGRTDGGEGEAGDGAQKGDTGATTNGKADDAVAGANTPESESTDTGRRDDDPASGSSEAADTPERSGESV